MHLINYRFICLIVIVCMVGCTSMKPVKQESPEQSIQFKDRIVVYEKSGRIVDMKVVKIEQNQITGSLTEDPLSSVTIHFDDIEKIELESVDGGKTVLAVIGGILLLPILLLGLLFGVAESVESNSQ